MNVQKSELKMAMAQDLGKQFETREQGLIAETHRLEGASGALKQAVENLEGIKSYYQREVDDNKFDEKDLPIVMKVVDRCRGVLLSLRDVAQTQKLVKQGEAQEAKKALDLIEKIFNDEKAKVEHVLKALEDGDIAPEDVGRAVDGSSTLRVVDGRPTNDAAADLAARRAAAKAEKAAKVEPPAPAVEAPKPPDPEPVVAEAKPEPSPEPPVPQSSIPTPRRQVVNRRKR